MEISKLVFNEIKKYWDNLDEKNKKKIREDKYYKVLNSNMLQHYRNAIEDMKERDTFEERYKNYISEMMFAELYFAYKRDNIKIENNQERTLVYVLGDVLEPLFFSICKWQPNKVVLLVNDIYSDGTNGKDRYEQVEEVLKEINQIQIPDKVEENAFIEKVKSLDAFKVGNVRDVQFEGEINIGIKLQEIIKEETGEVIIDITGGKKSMAAQAFLIAAYNNIKISYVDFQPMIYVGEGIVGISSKVIELDNPYTEYAINEWERIKTCFEEYRFKEAEELVRDLKKRTEITQLEKDGLKQLGEILRLYGDWDCLNWKPVTEYEIENVREQIVIPKAMEHMPQGKRQEISFKDIQKEYEEFRKGKYRGFNPYESRIIKNKKLNQEVEYINRILSRQNKIEYYIDNYYRAQRMKRYYNEYKDAIILSHTICEQIINEVYDEIDELEVQPPKSEIDKNTFKIVSKKRAILFFKEYIEKDKNYKDEIRVGIKDEKKREKLIQLMGEEKSGKDEFFFKLVTLAEIRNNLTHSNIGLTENIVDEALAVTKEFIIRYCKYKNDTRYLESNGTELKKATELDWKSVINACGLDKFIIER